MADRFSASESAKSLRIHSHPPLKTRHRKALHMLARSEARITGTLNRRVIRDVGIGALRAVTLLGAVLIPTLSSDEPAQAGNPLTIEKEPVTLVINPSQPLEAQTPAQVNLDLNLTPVNERGEPDVASTKFEIHNHRPVFVKRNATLTLGVTMSEEYWYRTELGVNDVFWALPDGNFYFEVQSIGNCARPNNSADCRLQLDFAFNTGATTDEDAAELGVNIDGLIFGSSSEPAIISGNSREIECARGEAAAYHADTAEQYQPWHCDFGRLRVSIRQPELSRRRAANGKVALDVKWVERN